MDFQFKKSSFAAIRNFMKPTSCSDARKGRLQATVTSPVSTDMRKSLKNSNSLKASSRSFTVSSSPTAVKVLNRQSSLKPARFSMKKSSTVDSCAKKNLNRATCSTTMKDSKFPAALVLDHGATEAEGTSKMRVCPYTYCSLNGHIHKSLPPLKCFVSARKKLLEAQKNRETMGLFSVRTSENQEEKIDRVRLNDTSKVSSDLFVDICTVPQEDIIEVNCDEKDQELLDCMYDVVDSSETIPQMNDHSDTWLEYGYGMDRTSEFSQDEMDDVMMSFLEYVEIGNDRKSQEGDYEFKQCRDLQNSGIEATNMDWEDGQFSGNTINSEVAESDSRSGGSNSDETDKDDSIRSSSDLPAEFIVDMVPNSEQRGTETMAAPTCERNDGAVDDEKASSETQNFHTLGDESNKLEKELLESSNGTEETMPNDSTIDSKENGTFLSSRWNISRKEKTEEFEQEKEFNPRPPNFLPLEPDPEAEKIDLRHQMMDGRRNSEEWMVDYALQQAVERLGGPARKRKVALLVEAFETVVPLHLFEEPHSHGTSAFSNLSFIQACS